MRVYKKGVRGEDFSMYNGHRIYRMNKYSVK